MSIVWSQRARRHLPRGWADLGRQLAIWFGFAVLYQLARGVADRKPRRWRSRNGRAVVDLETHLTHRLYELTLQNFVDQRHLLGTAVSWTYWNSEFTVVGLAVLWVYLRRHDAFVALPELDPAREHDRALRLHLDADGAAAAARPRLRRRAPRRPRQPRREPLRRDAEPARRGRADRRRRALLGHAGAGGRRRSGSPGRPGSGSP